MPGLTATLAALGIAPAVEQSLGNFRLLFHKWNQRINLSAARTEPELLEHVIDSLHVIPHLRGVAPRETGAPAAVLDVGAGGGLPAVVAAICLPHAQVTALEPVHKKHAFLRTAARELSLPNLDARAERLEDHPAHDYDAVMSRATFDLREWLLLGLARARIGGVVLGFEAIPRSDLPPGSVRHPYALDTKSRAIIVLARFASA
jgi:16S rRNA (guanine527-N7)-methyltransferase